MKPHSRLRAYQSKRFEERRKMRIIFISLLIVISIFTWIFTLSRLSMLSIFTINTIEVNGIDPSIAIKLQASVQDALQGNYLGIFSRSNTLLYPHDKIVAVTEKASPQIEDIKVSRDGLNGLNIIVKEKDPAAIVCTDLPDFSSNNSIEDISSCYFADKEGYIYKKISDLENNYNRYYIPELADHVSSTTDILGTYATSTKLFKELQDFYNKTVENGISTIAILIKGDGEYELYAKNKNIDDMKSDDDTMVVYFNEYGSFTEELANLIAFWDRAVVESKNSGRDINFEYIDIRYVPNVFYRKMQ